MADDILDMYRHTLTMAIEKEQDSYRFYKKAMSIVKGTGLKEFFSWLVNEEIRHERILTEFRDKVLNEKDFSKEELKIEGVHDISLGKYLVSEDIDEDSGYQDALIIAMKREEKAVALFTDLKAMTTYKELGDLYSKLKEEETKHLKSLEEKYDEEILTDN